MNLLSFFNDMPRDIVKDIIVGLAGSSFTLLTAKIKNSREYSVIRKLISKDYRIIISGFKDFNGFEPTGLMGMADTMALLELQKNIKKKNVLQNIRQVGNMAREDYDKNLIIIGGPDVNELAEYYLKESGSAITYPKGEGSHMIALHDNIRNIDYMPSSAGFGDVQSDTGFIINFKIPDSDQLILLIFGCTGLGTQEAMKMLFSKKLKKELKKLRSKEYECIIAVSNDYNYFLHSELLKPRSIIRKKDLKVSRK